jgi:hypothetical protein
MEIAMKTLWKEALHAWLTAPRRLRLSELPDHIRRDVGIDPAGPAPNAVAAADPPDLLAAFPARAIHGLQ